MTRQHIVFLTGADIFVVIGTSLQVHPAANFINYAHHAVPRYVIDPGKMDRCVAIGYTHFKTTATKGMRKLMDTFNEL